MKTAFLISLAFGSFAFAAPEQLLSPVRPSAEIEAVCRFRAKEFAVETYRSCVAEEKNSQIDQIKKDYEAKLKALKAQYEAELKKMKAMKEKASVQDIIAAEKRVSKKAARAAKKTAKKQKADSSIDEMTIQLRPAVTPIGDESSMDLPEPIPVEDISAGSVL